MHISLYAKRPKDDAVEYIAGQEVEPVHLAYSAVRGERVRSPAAVFDAAGSPASPASAPTTR